MRVSAVAHVRADLDPQLAERLGIDTSWPLEKQEIAHLLIGLRADGETIDHVLQGRRVA